jgi:hypothetical protein
VKRKANHHLYQRTNHRSSSNINSNLNSKGNINNLSGPQQLLSLLRPSRTSITNSNSSFSIISNSSKSSITKSS